MKILHVISGLDPKLGGVGQAVRTIITGLAQQGHQNEVASSDAPHNAWSQADPFVTHALGPGRGPWNYSPQLLAWLTENLSHFDAVILHGLWLYQGYALRKALGRARHQFRATSPTPQALPKVFVMPHGMLDPYFQRATGRKLKAWRNKVYWQLIEGAVINEAAGLLFTCETERLLAHEPFAPYRPQRELVVGLGVEEPPAYAPAMQQAFLAKCPTVKDRPFLLFLSRIHEKKGVDLLLQAYLDLARAHALAAPGTAPPPLPLLVVAGPGLDTPYGQHMQQLAAGLVEAGAVCFPGMLTGAAKWGAFYGCEAFVLPSHQENFGIAVVEALACHKPVLISNQVNIWREISAGGGGLVADDTLPGTQHLLRSWQQLAAPARQAMAQQAQLTYQQCFAVVPAAQRLALALTEPAT